jgi:hypothetical protein
MAVVGMDGVLADHRGYTQAACCQSCVDSPNCAAATFSFKTTSSSSSRCVLRTNGTDLVATVDASTSTAIVRDVSDIHQGGRYGVWEHDADGFPVYCYTLDQTAGA